MSSCDKLVFDLAQEVEGTPNVFLRKDYLNVIDSNNSNYNSNQIILETSSLSNSNKFLNYREGYLQIPLLLTLSQDQAENGGFSPATSATSVDSGVGLKSWYGNMIHSFQLEYNGVTICQTTPFINVWNNFQLLTTMSWNDVITQGSTIGFYPDDCDSWEFTNNVTTQGVGVCNNRLKYTPASASLVTKFNARSGAGNNGYLQRQLNHLHNPEGTVGDTTYTTLQTEAQVKSLYRNYILAVDATATVVGHVSHQVLATVMLKHLHPFFNSVPLIKGAYLRMILQVNNSSCHITTSAAKTLTVSNISNPNGGVVPFIVASANADDALANIAASKSYIVDLSVGNKVLNSTLANLNLTTGQLASNVSLYVPSYIFNPIFENAYLSQPIKQINYTDVYQFEVKNIAATQTFNHLVTNGIAGIQSILIVPFYSTGATNNKLTVPSYQSPFDTAGCGTTSPLCHITNFNVVVSGQNAIYNTQKYTFEQFNHQLYNTNKVNGGMIDGVTSGLISRKHFENNYCFYYVDLSRQLPVEESVPKSVSIIGQNMANKTVDYMVFIEYKASISVDVLTGTRV